MAISKGIHTLLECDRISLALLDETGENFTMAIMEEPNPAVNQLAKGVQMPITASAASMDILARREHITSDLSTETEYPAEKILYDAGYRSRINLPLIVGERAIGSLNLTSRRLNAFSPAHVPVLQQIANAIAISIKNSELYQAELTRREELDALYSLSRKLANVTNAEIILELVAQHSVETIHVTFVRIVTLDENFWIPRTMQSIRAHEIAVNDTENIPITATPLAWKVLQNNQPAIIHSDDARLGEAERAYLFLSGVQTLCLVPLTLGERRIGLLMLGEERHAEREPFTAEKIRLAHNIADQAASALHRVELFTELENAYLQTVLALANAVDAKDSDTNVHSQRLAQLALAVGKELGLNARALEDLHYGALLHDIGKIGVPDAILNKPAALTPNEWDKMHQHPTIGSQIIAPVPRLAGAAAIVRHHHERYDGKGYPAGLAGDAIPLGARILTVVDSYGAIIDKRVYKEGRPHAEAIAEIKRCTGTQFDPAIVQAFLRVIDRIGRT
jgi:HD-GYP domain-containing protein (c-di-GMP phosphodiesterase class II)